MAEPDSSDRPAQEPAPNEESGLGTQEARFRKAIEGAQDTAVLWLDSRGIIQNSNSVVQRMLGYTEKELQGKPLDLLFIPEDLETKIPEMEMRAAIEKGQAVDERWHVRKDNSRFWAVGLMTPLWRKPGELEGYIKILRDRTDQKRAFDLARNTEERYKQLLDSTAEGIFGFDLDGRCTFVNASSLRKLGYPDEQAMLGKSIHEFIQHGQSGAIPCPGSDCPLLSGIREGKSSHGENVFKRSDGSRFPAEFNTFPIRSEGGIIGAVITFLDISDRKMSEARFKAMEKHLLRAQKLESIGRLAGGLAHELNNDLTGIIGYGELLMDQLEAGSALRPNLEEILRSGKRAADLIAKLVTFSGKQVVFTMPLQLDTLMKEKLPLFRKTLGGKVGLSLDLEPDLPKAFFDPGQLEQVILSILINAREALPDEGDLVLSGRRVDLSDPHEAEKAVVKPGIYICLTVKDKGRGIPEDIQEKLFEPFFSTKEMGSAPVGLGLSSAYGILKQSGGTILVESEPGRGTDVKLYLPTVPNIETA